MGARLRGGLGKWLMLLLVMVPVALKAQTNLAPAESRTPTRDSVPAKKSADSVAIANVVTFRDGRPVSSAAVVATSLADTPSVVRSTVTDSRGYFKIDSLHKGPYWLRVVYDGGTVSRKVAAGERGVGAIVADPVSSADTWLSAEAVGTLAAILVFSLTLLFVRWHHIAKSLHAMLNGQLSTMAARLQTEVDPSRRQAVHPLEEIIAELRREMEWSWRNFRPLEIIFWSRGRENSAWASLHEVERQLAAFLSPPERVDSYLLWADAELRGINQPPALALADAITVSLKPCDPKDRPQQEQWRKALLGSAIATINVGRDERFASLMEWQNKAAWLTATALTLIAFLAAVGGNSVLFLAGAAGGYVSRLMRALRRDDVPLDYGASWTTLFLSPLFGALTGWFGIALIVLLANPHLRLLGPAFDLVDWHNALAPATFSVAFLLGFSERFFDAIVGAVEKNSGLAEEIQRSPAAIGMVHTPVARMPSNDPATKAKNKGSDATAANLVISRVTTLQKVSGEAADGLEVHGTGFATGATFTIDEKTCETEFQSAELMLVTLPTDEFQKMHARGELKAQVINPSGESSNPFWFSIP